MLRSTVHLLYLTKSQSDRVIIYEIVGIKCNFDSMKKTFDTKRNVTQLLSIPSCISTLVSTDACFMHQENRENT